MSSRLTIAAMAGRVERKRSEAANNTNGRMTV